MPKSKKRPQRTGTRQPGRTAPRQAPRSRVMWLVLGVLALAVLTAMAATSGDPTDNDTEESTSQGPLRTEPPWPPQYGGLRSLAATFPPVGDESYHVHALLSVFVGGGPVRVPANIGIDQESGSHLPLHTHTPDGVIHFEADEPAPFTLGQLFAVWGVDFSPTRLGAYTAEGSNRVHVFINGERVEDPLDYAIKNQDNIVVAFGEEGSFPTEPSAAALEGA